MVNCIPVRKGVTLTEVLIGILILGLGVVSIASLFPVGLLRLKHAVDDTRSAQIGRAALGTVDASSVIHPPLGPVANVYIADPVLANGTIDPAQIFPGAGDGIPVVIDPLGILSRSDWAQQPDYPSAGQQVVDRRRLGFLQLSDGTVVSAGLPRYRGVYLSDLARVAGIDVARREAMALFAASDDIVYWGTQAQRSMPAQLPVNNPPQFLRPTNGVPFRAGTLLREARYTWFAIVRKVNNAQFPPARFDRVSNDDDSDVDVDEWHWPGDDGRYGPTGQDLDGNGIDDGWQTDRAVGPFHVTVVVVYRRSYGQDEAAIPFVFPVGPDGAPGVAGNDEDGDGVTDYFPDGTPDLDELAWPGSDDSPPNVLRIPLVFRGEQFPAPAIARGQYVIDATYTMNPGGPRHAYCYRVTDREQTFDPALGVPVLRITLETPVRKVAAIRPGGAGLQGFGSLVAMRGIVGAFDTVVGQ